MRPRGKALEKASALDAEREWSVYLAHCADGTLYTGIAKDVAARLARHNKGKGAAYTRARRPVRLVYARGGMTRSEALIREALIRRLPRALKRSLAMKAPEAAGGQAWAPMK